MKNVELYVNNSKKKAIDKADEVRKALIEAGYNLSCDPKKDPDIVIGFGGDGTLLKWLSTKNYNTEAQYIGVNCGSLGFLQDFEVKDAREFVKNIEKYIERKLNFVSLKLVNEYGEKEYLALNEFSILDSEDKALKTNVYISDEYFEEFVGTGLIFSTPTGSTARNISSTGSIMYHGIEAIQMTPCEAIVNRRIHCLAKSICIPKDVAVKLSPVHETKIKIIADGNRIYEGEYKEIIIQYSKSYMTKLTAQYDSFTKTIREKLI